MAELKEDNFLTDEEIEGLLAEDGLNEFLTDAELAELELGEVDAEEYLKEIDEVIDNNQEAYRGFRGRRTEGFNEVLDAMKDGRESRKFEAIKKRQEITRKYVTEGKEVWLHMAVDLLDLSELIRRLTADIADKITDTKRLLTVRVEKALRPQIPVELKRAHTKFPQAFIEHPGFLYINSEAYGGYKIWLKPNMPYFFKQFSEMEILSNHEDFQNYTFDKYVERYYVLKSELAKKEVALATKFEKVHTRLDLLEMSVKYFELYTQILKEKNAEDIL